MGLEGGGPASYACSLPPARDGCCGRFYKRNFENICPLGTGGLGFGLLDREKDKSRI